MNKRNITIFVFVICLVTISTMFFFNYNNKRKLSEANKRLNNEQTVEANTKTKKLVPKDKALTIIKPKSSEVKFKETSINLKLQRELNIFMSNFAEVPFDISFNEGKISDKNLILFGIWHNYRNSYNGISLHGVNRIEFEMPYDKLKKEYVDEAVKKYFNINRINHQTITVDKFISYEYKNGYYYIEHGDGDNPIDYSVVYKVENIGNEKYILYAKNYHNSEFTTKNPYDYNYYSLNIEKAEELYKNDLQGYTVEMVNAKVQKINDNGVERYILLQYNKSNKSNNTSVKETKKISINSNKAIDLANATKSIVVKSLPGTSYKTLGTIKNGTTVEVYGGVPSGIDQGNWAEAQKYGWSEIKYENKYAWVDTSDLKFNNPLSWAPGIKEKFEKQLIANGDARTKEEIHYKNPSIYANEGFYEVFTDLYGTNHVTNVNVKTGWCHGA